MLCTPDKAEFNSSVFSVPALHPHSSPYSRERLGATLLTRSQTIEKVTRLPDFIHVS